MLNVIFLLSLDSKLKKQEMLAVRKMKLKEEMDRKKKRSGRDSAGPAPATPQY